MKDPKKKKTRTRTDPANVYVSDPVEIRTEPTTTRRTIPVEDLRVGDVVDVEGVGVTTIRAVKPLDSRFPELFATVDTDPGLGFALQHGDTIVVLDVAKPLP